jgi:predicted DNA-binding transcriptional regulator AlpA
LKTGFLSVIIRRMKPADKATKRHRLDAKDVIAAWVRERGLRGMEDKAPEGPSPVRVLTLDQVAERSGTTRRNIERLNAAGKGPRLTQISVRKIGVLEEDFAEWLRARRRPAASKADETEGS